MRIVSGCLLFIASGSEPGGRLILGIYAKASIGLVMHQSHFSGCLKGGECDSFCGPWSLSLSKECLASNQRFGKAREAECHQNQRVSGSNLFSCQVLLGDPVPWNHCQLCGLQQFGRAKKFVGKHRTTNCWLIAKTGDDSINGSSKAFCQLGEKSNLNLRSWTCSRDRERRQIAEDRGYFSTIRSCLLFGKDSQAQYSLWKTVM